jgi:hypothetical protein
MSRSNRVSSAITNSAYSDGLDGPYTHSRRPMTLHGLSRERNRVMMTSTAIGSRDAMSHTSTSPMKASGTYTASVNKRAGSSSNHDHPNHHQQQQQQQQEYHYVDLQEQFAKGRVDRSSSSQQSQRNDVLKQYDDVMFEFNKTINNNNNKSNNNHNSPNHKHSGVNDEVIMSFDGITMHSSSSSVIGGDLIDDNNQHNSSSCGGSSSSNRRAPSSSFMCSPISTPQRPTNTPIGASPSSMHKQKTNNNSATAAVAAAAAKILPTSINSRPNTVSIHTPYRGRGDYDSNGDSNGATDGDDMISKSLNDLKKCYSMPSIHRHHSSSSSSSSKHKKGKGYNSNSCISIETSADPNITTTSPFTSTPEESPSLNHGNEHSQQDGDQRNVNDQSTTDDDTSVHVTIVESHDDKL